MNMTAPIGAAAKWKRLKIKEILKSTAPIGAVTF
jgi:hypothetical protein